MLKRDGEMFAGSSERRTFIAALAMLAAFLVGAAVGLFNFAASKVGRGPQGKGLKEALYWRVLKR